MYEVKYGDKYDKVKNLSTVEIGKLVRADIKEAVRLGVLLKGKYSVRCKYFSGGSSLDVEVSEVPGLAVYTKEWLDHLEAKTLPRMGCECYTPEAKALLNKVKAMVNAYNFDGSEIQVDYFHVNFYGDVRFDWRWVHKIHGVI